MFSLDARLIARLDTRGVRIDAADANGISLRHVPARADRFTKARTNLLAQRPRPGLPFVVGVDEDFDYVGPDPGVSRLFAAALRQRGWRILRIDLNGHTDVQAVLECALRLVGFDGEEPAVEAAAFQRANTGLLAAGTSLTARVRDGSPPPTAGRAAEVEAVAASLLQWQGRLPAIVSQPGAGKTNLLYAVARRLADARPSLELIRIDLSDLFAGTLFDAEREHVLAALLREASARQDLVLCLERLELVSLAVPEGPLVLNGALEGGLRIVATALPASMATLRALPLARRLQIVELAELDAQATTEVLRLVSGDLARHHQVGIDEAAIPAAVARAASLDGFFPAKAIALLDAAAARASLAGAAAVSVVHVYLAANDFAEDAAGA